MPGARQATASRRTRKPRVLIISGDEAAIDPSVRALAADAETVIGIGMFEESFRGLADLVLPGTSYLERDGTTVNLEGRLQRQRRAVLAPVPGRARVDREARRALRGRALALRVGRLRRGRRALLRRHRATPRSASGAELPERGEAPTATPASVDSTRSRGQRRIGLRLVAYRPLFSGPAVERTPELQFQRPDAEVELLGRRRALARDPQRRDRHGLVERHVASSCARGSRATSRPASCASPSDHAADLHPSVEVKA